MQPTPPPTQNRHPRADSVRFDGHTNLQSNRWTPGEEALLRRVSDRYPNAPARDVTREYNERALTKRWPYRSLSALRQRVKHSKRGEAGSRAGGGKRKASVKKEGAGAQHSNGNHKKVGRSLSPSEDERLEVLTVADSSDEEDDGEVSPNPEPALVPSRASNQRKPAPHPPAPSPAPPSSTSATKPKHKPARSPKPTAPAKFHDFQPLVTQRRLIEERRRLNDSLAQSLAMEEAWFAEHGEQI